MNSLHYTKGIFKKFSGFAVAGSIILVVILIFVLSRSNKESGGIFPDDSSQPSFTPYPTSQYTARELTPTEVKVIPTEVFESYTLDSRFNEIPSSELPTSLGRADTRVYESTASGQPRENLRVSVYNNASNITLTEFVEQEKKGFIVSDVKYYKYMNYNAASIYFKGSDAKSLARTTVVYVPTSFYVFAYSQSLDDRGEAEVYAKIDAFVEDFIANYNWTAVSESSGGYYDLSPRYENIQNEIDYQKGSDEPKP